MNIEKKKEICKRLRDVKACIFQDTISKLNYMKIQKEVGEELPFYRQIVELNNIITELEEDIKISDEKCED